MNEYKINNDPIEDEPEIDDGLEESGEGEEDETGEWA